MITFQLTRLSVNLAVNLAVILAVSLMAGCAAAPAEQSTETTGESLHRVGNLIVDGIPEPVEGSARRLQQYQNTRAASLRGWVGDSLLIATRFADTTQLHLVGGPLMMREAMREQITFFNEPVSQAYLPPASNDDGFIYARDVGGSEFYQLFWHDWETSNARMLTDGSSRYSSVVFSNGGDQFAYTTTERNGRSWDIHTQAVPDAEGAPADRKKHRVVLETESGAWSALEFSPDDDRLLVRQYLSINESYLYELTLSDGKLRPLLGSSHPSISASTSASSIRTSVGDAGYAADGKGVYFTSDMGAEFMRLHYLRIDTGHIEVLTADVPWDVEAFTLSDDGRSLGISINEGGVSRVSVWRLPQHTPIAMPEIPQGALTGLAFSDDSTRLAMSINRANSPTDVFVFGLGERTLIRWTRSEVGGLDTDRFVVPELIEYPTFDQTNSQPRQIPAFIFKPAGAGPHPVLISIHGGPEGQYRPRFSPTFQYLVNELGIAVIAPNVRGSAGYGKTYLRLDNGYLREDSVRDIGALLDWVAEQEDLDPARVAVLGGSYGGYMVLAAMVHYSKRLAAGVESVGISDFVTFLTNTQDYRRDLRRAEYGDERDPQMRAFLESISPLRQVDKIDKPMMISQGANDPRVPASESAQIVMALREQGIPVWYLLALDEGHGFRKKANRDYSAAVMVQFLEQYLIQ